MRQLAAYGAAVAMVVLGPVFFVGNLTAGAWWFEPDVVVPRDGQSHAVTLDDGGSDYAIWSDRSLVDPICGLSGPDGTDVALWEVPRTERIYLDEPWVAEPEASFVFTSPADGAMTVTCDPVDATPVQTLELGPVHPKAFYVLVQGGLLVVGPLLLIAGLLLAAITARHSSRAEQPAPQEPSARAGKTA